MFFSASPATVTILANDNANGIIDFAVTSQTATLREPVPGNSSGSGMSGSLNIYLGIAYNCCVCVCIMKILNGLQRSQLSTHARTYKHPPPPPTHTHTHKRVLAHCQNWSRWSPRDRGERLKRNLGKMTQLANEPPNGHHPLKPPNYG